MADNKPMTYLERRELLGEFYRSKLWKKVRETALKRDNYLCQRCGAPADVVHHIVHLTPQNVYDDKISINLDNLMSLCSKCHSDMHYHEHGKGRINEENYPYMFDENGMLIPKGKQ